MGSYKYLRLKILSIEDYYYTAQIDYQDFNYIERGNSYCDWCNIYSVNYPDGDNDNDLYVKGVMDNRDLDIIYIPLNSHVFDNIERLNRSLDMCDKLNKKMKNCKYLRLKFIDKDFDSGYYIAKIEYQDFNIFPRGKFKNEEFKIYSEEKPSYHISTKKLFIKGESLSRDDGMLYIKSSIDEDSTNFEVANELVEKIININAMIENNK